MSKMLSKMNLISVVQQLPKEDIETIQGYVEMIEEENQELKKQLEEYKKKLMIATKMEIKEIDKNTFVGIDYFQDKCISYKNQQKEFIEWLEAMSRMYENEYKDIDVTEHYNCVLQKYKEIIGVSNENNMEKSK